MYIPFNGSKSGFNIATSEPRRVVFDTSIQFLFVKRWTLAFMPTLVTHLSHCCVLREFSLLPRELLFELLFTASGPSTITVAHRSLAAVWLSTYWSRVEETICLNWGFRVDFYTFTIQMLFESMPMIYNKPQVGSDPSVLYCRGVWVRMRRKKEKVKKLKLSRRAQFHVFFRAQFLSECGRVKEKSSE